MAPLGFHFVPTDEELLNFYLTRKVRGEDLLWDGILEFDIYGEKAPWEICGNQEEEKVYLFTRLKKLSKNRVARSAGCGVWHENSSEKVCDKHGHVIGARKLFCFKVKQGSSMKKSNWIMHEFSLVGEQPPTNNWVLCTIQNKGFESRKTGLKRCFQDMSVSVEIENPQPQINTEVLPLEDGTGLTKRMRCDVECDVPEASETLFSQFGTPETDCTTSENSLLIWDNIELETFMSCFPANDGSDCSPEDGLLPLGAWVDFCDVDFDALCLPDSVLV